MKTLRQICAATILSLTLAVAAFAGDIHCPGVAATETGTTTTTTETTTTTDILTTIILAIVTVDYR